jgi:hypothetical protein
MEQCCTPYGPNASALAAGRHNAQLWGAVAVQVDCVGWDYCCSKVSHKEGVALAADSQPRAA